MIDEPASVNYVACKTMPVGDLPVRKFVPKHWANAVCEKHINLENDRRSENSV
jgi:hypothetical protein